MKDSIELRHLRYFLAVAETLHFGRAATKLGMAQPPLSQQIKRLETLVGAPLFERTTRGVRLTPAGAMLRERATATLSRLADDLDQTRRVARGEEGRLTVGFSGAPIRESRCGCARCGPPSSWARWRTDRSMWDFCGMASGGRSWR
jgi:DNA-binding transcriptional LysR family regulator